MYNCSKSSQLFIIIICYNLRYVFLSFEFIKDIYSILFYSILQNQSHFAPTLTGMKQKIEKEMNY